MLATSEAMVLGMKAGLDPALVYTLVDSAGASKMFEVRGPLMRDAQYDPATATIGTHLKDVEIINSFANSLRCPTPVFSAAAQPYYARAAQGFEMQDTASVCARPEGPRRFRLSESGEQRLVRRNTGARHLQRRTKSALASRSRGPIAVSALSRATNSSRRMSFGQNLKLFQMEPSSRPSGSGARLSLALPQQLCLMDAASGTHEPAARAFHFARPASR